MSDIKLFYTSTCSKCRIGLEVLGTNNIEPEVVHYLKENPDRKTLEDVIEKLEDPISDLVRRDSFFKENIATQPAFDQSQLEDPQAVLDLLLEHPRLMQRPILVKGNAAIIGRSTPKIEAFLARETS